ncbi:MAG: bacillithiol biosynthesis deacetylase BshB1 [bacterium]|nr:bacillithiol biosynthesis deacetylase BshB1 [bacterium]
MNFDILAFGTHPDDIELCVGGILIKASKAGQKVGVVDLTQGELGSRGDEKIRNKEAILAKEILGIKIRENLSLGDGKLYDNYQNRFIVADTIRKYKPKIILAPFEKDRHPDHVAASMIIEKANFDARLKKLESDYPPHATNQILFYLTHEYYSPTLIVDISEVFFEKMRAIKAYDSQFCAPISSEECTPIGISNYIFHIESRMRFYGSLINVNYGEPLISKYPLKIINLMRLFS